MTAMNVLISSKSTPASLACVTGYLDPPDFNNPTYLSNAGSPSSLTFLYNIVIKQYGGELRFIFVIQL